ncbi:MAG: hypothetical protein KatS3mg111_1913 [Pirellulaceae bacterium]|nr:MAG: hypothetical protein KatS3mg111_1913 [Pirellulaceae bacterium]
MTDRSSACRSSEAVEEATAGRSADIALAKRLIDKEPEAWTEFISTYASLIRWRVGVVARSLGVMDHSPLIDDLTEDVFTALLERDCASLRSFKGRSSLATYVGVITSRVALRRLTASAKQIPNASVEDHCQHLTSDDGPEQKICQREEIERLLREVDRLPPRGRQLVTLFYLEGKTYEQIRVLTGIPIGSIGPTITRALQRLRSELNHSASDPTLE